MIIRVMYMGLPSGKSPTGDIDAETTCISIKSGAEAQHDVHSKERIMNRKLCECLNP
jgi:hypothetical protein